MSHEERHHHRAGESGNFSKHRNAVDPLVKWAVGAFLLLLLAFVTGVGGWAFSTVDGKADKGVEANAEVQLVKKDVEYLKEDVRELKTGQKTIVRGMQTIIDTLYTLPAERRSTAKPVLEQPDQD
jgi:hypothetical protein